MLSTAIVQKMICSVSSLVGGTGSLRNHTRGLKFSASDWASSPHELECDASLYIVCTIRCCVSCTETAFNLLIRAMLRSLIAKDLNCSCESVI